MNAVWQELRLASRALLRNPGFAVAATLTLAIGIAAVTTVFALVEGIVLAPLPFPQSERLVAVGHSAPGLALEGTGMSTGTYLHYRAHARAFSGIATYHESVVNLADGEREVDHEAERVPVATVTHDFFTVLGARTAVGRLPAAADADGSGERVVLLSHELWQRRYGGDPAIVGRTIEPNRVPRRVLGVLAPGFAFPRREVGIFFPSDPDPASARAADLYNEGIGRLAPGFDTAAAERDLDRLLATLPEAFPDLSAQAIADARLRASVRPLRDTVVGETGPALWLLLAAMAILLLIACANVANLFFVRGEHRAKEIAVRTALGARGRHLVRAFAAEGLVLALAGGALGLLAAAGAVRALAGREVSQLPRLDEVKVDGPVAGVTLALSLAIALLLAVLPLIRLRRRQVTAVLGARGSASGGRRGQRTRRLLVAAQVALALTLLSGSALLARSLWLLTRADAGFRSAGVLTADLALPRTAYGTYQETRRFWEALSQRVAALPGVDAVGMASSLPLVPQGAFHDLAVEVEDRPHETRRAVSVYHATPGYFAAMGVPVVRGRGPEAAGEVERPVWLSTAAARRLFPGRDAVGRRIRRGVAAAGEEPPWATVAGVVGDVPRERVGGEPAEIVYLPVLAAAVDPDLRPSYGTLVVRTSLPPDALAPALRAVVRELDPHLPLAAMRTMEEVVARSASRTVFVMVVLGVAALAALALGTVGLYGVISYTVRRRTHEVGIRVALGARGADIRNVVLGESAALALGGIAAGIVAALAVTRFLRGLLYEVGPGDPLVLGTVAALVLAVSLVAGWLPARRAARIDPLTALREE